MFYTIRSNAKRAARKALGKTATEGVHYRIVTDPTLGGQFGFESINKPSRPAGKRSTGILPPLGPKPRKPKKAVAPNGPARGSHGGGQVKVKEKRAAKSAKPAVGNSGRKASAWLDSLMEMLARPQGATAAEVGEAFGWLEHTSRARISVGPRARNARSVRTREERGGKMISVYRLLTELPLGQKREELGVLYQKPASKPAAAAA